MQNLQSAQQLACHGARKFGLELGCPVISVACPQAIMPIFYVWHGILRAIAHITAAAA
jgi:hypothetical protein